MHDHTCFVKDLFERHRKPLIQYLGGLLPRHHDAEDIAQETYARQLPVRLVQEDDADIPDDEVVSRIVQMNNMNAPQAVPILRPLLPQYAHLAALPEENVVLIVDRYANVRRLTELLNALDN